MEQLIFSKYSNERSREFAVRTDMIKTDTGRYVKKTALYPEGEAHLASIPEKERALAPLYREAGWECNHCEPCEDGIRLEYVNGRTLEEQLDQLLLDGRAEKAGELLTEFLKKIENSHSKTAFQMTEEFETIFGEVPPFTDALCAENTNIDLICANLLCSGEGEDGSLAPVVLDYEWTFSFPIPVRYLLYRVIHYYLDAGAGRKALSAETFYQQFGLSMEERKIYADMEASFQKYLIHGMTPMREMFQAITPGVHSMQEASVGYLQVYFRADETYSEDDSVKVPIQESRVDTCIAIPDDCIRIRLDPCADPCIVNFEELSFDTAPVVLHNRFFPKGDCFGSWGYFPEKDPAIVDLPVPPGTRELRIRAEICPTAPGAVLHAMEKERESRDGHARIDQMEQTKVWKLYRKYRDLREGKHENG